MSFALIIEDDFLLAFAVEEALRKLGYSDFEIVNSVSAAIAAALNRCPDLIVADHQITDGTGTDAVLEICSDRPIPVVFVTASASEVRSRLPDALIVEKPLSPTRLGSAVSQAGERPFRRPGNAGPTLKVMD